MKRLRAVFPSISVALLAMGCGGEHEAETAVDNWPSDAAGPAGAGQGVRVFSGEAATLSTQTSCTWEAGADGDRWCVFIGVSSAGDHNLFALDVTQVIAGVPVSCGEPDPNCVLLTEHLLGSSGDYHPTYFAGDTLVYYDRSLTPHVWRPGMEAGRVLAERPEDGDIAFCTPSSHGMAVACLGMPFERADPGILAAELYIGAADGESEPLLAPVDDVIVATLDDTSALTRFGLGSPVSGYIAWSSREELEGPEILNVREVSDPESRITVAVDVHRWDISADGSGWLWLSAVDQSGVGTLQSARFYDGAYPVDILENVVDYELDENGSVLAWTANGEMVSIPDPIGAPSIQVPIDGDVADIAAFGSSGVAYTKRPAEPGVNDLRIASLDGTRSCLLQEGGSKSLRTVQFAPGAPVAIWARENADDQYDAEFARLADCTSVVLSPEIAMLGWVGRGHAVFVDQFDSNKGSGTLRYRKVGRNGELHPDPPTVIAEHADTYATWGPNFLLYTVTSGSDEDGMYVRAFGG